MVIVFVTLVLLVIIVVTSMNVKPIYTIVPIILHVKISMVAILVHVIKVTFSMERNAVISMNALLVLTTVTKTPFV